MKALGVKDECAHPVGVSLQRSDHGDEERLLQQSDHGADHGLEACQGAEVVGRVAVGEIRTVKESYKKHQVKRRWGQD